MRSVRWVLAAGLLLLLGHPALARERPRTTAMIGTCSYRDWVLPSVHPVEIQLIGGLLAGTGWVSDVMFWSDSSTGPWKVAGYVAGRGQVDSVIDAGHFMREGERVSIYYLESGVLGEAQLTDYASDAPVGLLFGAEPVVSPGKEVAFRREPRSPKGDRGPQMLAAWTPGGRPRWVTGRLLDQSSAAYRSVVEQWLAGKGVSKQVIARVVIEQIIRADINGDGREEVFLSFHTPGTPLGRRRSNRRAFSYVLMRHLPRHSRRVQTALLDDSPARLYTIHGFCDLDRDGVAEVATDYYTTEAQGTALFRWHRGRFAQVAGQEGTVGD